MVDKRDLKERRRIINYDQARPIRIMETQTGWNALQSVAGE